MGMYWVLSASMGENGEFAPQKWDNGIRWG